MADQPAPIDVDVLPPQQRAITPFGPIKLNLGTTLQSPFFWLVVGVGIGVWVCKSRKFRFY